MTGNAPPPSGPQPSRPRGQGDGGSGQSERHSRDADFHDYSQNTRGQAPSELPGLEEGQVSRPRPWWRSIWMILAAIIVVILGVVVVSVLALPVGAPEPNPSGPVPPNFIDEK